MVPTETITCRTYSELGLTLTGTPKFSIPTSGGALCPSYEKSGDCLIQYDLGKFLGTIS
jgi:hypothetical protein